MKWKTPPPVLTWSPGWRGQVESVLFVVTAAGWLAGPLLLAMVAIAVAPTWLGAALLIGALGWIFLLAALARWKTGFARSAVAFVTRPFGRALGLIVGLVFFALAMPAFISDKLGVTLPLPEFWLTASRTIFP